MATTTVATTCRVRTLRRNSATGGVDGVLRRCGSTNVTSTNVFRDGGVLESTQHGPKLFTSRRGCCCHEVFRLIGSNVVPGFVAIKKGVLGRPRGTVC